MKTKHLFLLATLALTLFACEYPYPYETQWEDCIVDFSYEVNGRTITVKSECVCPWEFENYAWDFGDGDVINEPIVSETQKHTYEKAGEYKVSLHIAWKDPKNMIWSKGAYKMIKIE